MDGLEQKLGYKFNNINLLKNALTHSSYANEVRNGFSSNERLEFLGDSVLSIVVSDYIYKHYPNMPEGELTKLRASLVCEKSLCTFSRELELGSYLMLGKGEDKGGGRERDSILADAFEAVLAAIYLDGGMEPARRHVMNFVLRELKHTDDEVFKDYKTALQEIIQRNPEESVTYILTDESGPDHDKSFTVEVRLNSNVIGKGTGKNKKRAEQMAAKEALMLMGEEI
ncbi:MAG TPA: ribonuclease III [Ruminococcaceae bacterium]|nr:ribonuclease III [Oscillospiraceae bacterium]HBJ11264.1 ribonuclease III [Oscillospiraceae bacterium]